MPPLSRDELLHRARALDGCVVGELARRLGVHIGEDPRRTKGSVGELVERALGAEAGSLDLPDFPRLGVELKTVPVDERGRVMESTYVCVIDLDRVDEQEWETSRLWRKLACVLWVPVEAAGMKALADRRLGTPRLWSPNAEQIATLRADWTELMGLIALGGIEEVTAHLGQALQIRPKGKNALDRVSMLTPSGDVIEAMPRAFYLRARFTEAVLWSAASRSPSSG